MDQPRHSQQRPISKEEKLAWIYRSDLYKRTNPTDKSQQSYKMNPQKITEMGAGSASSAPTPCNITPPVVSSSQSDRNFHTRSTMNSGSSFQAQSTGYQQSPSQPLGGSQGPSKTRDRSNWYNHSWERILEELKKPGALPEFDPLGSERVRIGARKEVRKRQLDNKNTQLNQFIEQADPSQGSEIASRKPDITRLEAMMDEQMRDVIGAIDRIESEAKFRLSGQQYRGTMELAGPSQEPANETSQPQPSMEGLSTCYYWDKHQKDSTQPPCQLGLACRFPHRYIGGAPVASAQYKPDANPRRSLSPASIIRRHRQVTEESQIQPNAPSLKPPFRVGHPVSQRPIDKTPMKYSPPPRPSGPSPLGSNQRSMAELRVPQVSLALRPKVKSAPPAFQDTEVNIFEQNSLGNSRMEIYDLPTLPKESNVKWDDPSDPSSFSSARRYYSSYSSQESGSAQQMSEWSNPSIGMGLITRGRRKIAAEQALAEEEQYGLWFEDNQQGFHVPFETSHPATSRFALDRQVLALSTSSPEYQVKKLEREFRESEERGEKEINERARVGSVGPKASPEPEDHFKTAFMNALNAAEEERKLTQGRERKRELKDTPNGPLHFKDMRDGVTFNGTLSSGNVLENHATMAEQPAPNNKPLTIRPRPINPHKQEPAPGTARPKPEQLENKPTFHQQRPIRGPRKRIPIPANFEREWLNHLLSINPLESTNLTPNVEQPQRQPLNSDETKRPDLGLEKKKITPAEARRRHKIAGQNAIAKSKMLHSAGASSALNGAAGENTQPALRQPEAKEPAPKQTSQRETDKPAPKLGHTEEDDHFSDIELADEEKASSAASGEEGEDWIVVEKAV
ncbi:hypothetical protein NA56DRAFT_77624 [Hyaloscypha hepaticicola]|uniref:Uncharacterized protein n=1 Tax=Hyaloscypha hepaticicola TaxID=2082293 RepID=A0A2J6Q9E1_9HELO|nr:hypothetical protein NA56DRAFT_77624 [Hyaloscypha hepaticicola]